MAAAQSASAADVATSKRIASRNARELEEYRKFGLAPLAVDAVTGQEISPHIPQTIAAVPWYVSGQFGQGAATLQHQRKAEATSDTTLTDLVAKTVVVHQATKWRPGACENCGSMTHKRKECTERPRKVGAKYTNRDIAPDVVVVGDDRKRSFEQRHDAWSGMDSAALESITQRQFQALEAARERNHNADGDRLIDGALTSSAGGLNASSASRGKIDLEQTMVQANSSGDAELPKYLINLDPKSAFYDPKSRSMRADPNAGVDPSKATPTTFKGDNARNYGGDFQAFNQATLLALTDDRVAGLQPTKLARIQQEEKEKAAQLQTQRAAQLDAAYGPSRRE